MAIAGGPLWISSPIRSSSFQPETLLFGEYLRIFAWGDLHHTSDLKPRDTQQPSPIVPPLFFQIKMDVGQWSVVFCSMVTILWHRTKLQGASASYVGWVSGDVRSCPGSWSLVCSLLSLTNWWKLGDCWYFYGLSVHKSETSLKINMPKMTLWLLDSWSAKWIFLRHLGGACWCARKY